MRKMSYNALAFFFVSDDLDHNTSFVYELQRKTCNYIKNKLPSVSKVVMVVLDNINNSRISSIYVTFLSQDVYCLSEYF